MKVDSVFSEGIECNVFVVGDERCCVVVDCGAEVQKLEKFVGGRKVLAVLLTHGHFDHAYFCLEYAKKFGCKIYAGADSKQCLENSEYNCSRGQFSISDFSDFVFLQTDGKLTFQNIEVEYKILGGHTKSDVVYKIDQHLFVGDLLIGRYIGRTDLPGGDKGQMIKSLQVLLNEKFSVMHSGHAENADKKNQDKNILIWLKYLQNH